MRKGSRETSVLRSLEALAETTLEAKRESLRVVVSCRDLSGRGLHVMIMMEFLSISGVGIPMTAQSPNRELKVKGQRRGRKQAS